MSRRNEKDIAWLEWGFVVVFVVGIVWGIVSFFTYKALERVGSDGQNWLISAIIEVCVAVVCLGFWLWLIRRDNRGYGD